jgi:hypothetical protein
MIDFLKENFGTIITFVGGATAWGYERNKRNQEIKASETQNNKSIMDLYQEALDDLKARYDLKFSELQSEIKDLQMKLITRENEYIKLKKEFDDYKKLINSKPK